VTDPGQPDGVISDELMAILEAAKPTFAWVTPHLRTGARIGPADTVLVATDSADPWRFSAGLLHGSWISPGAVDQVIVPAAMLKAALPEGQEHSAIGKGLTVQFTRPRSPGVQEDRLSMTMVIAGISEAEVVFAPTRLLRDVERWREGKVLFNTTAGRFETPRAIYERSGHVRATIVASDVAALEPLVRRLEAAGYHVDSSLAQMSGLRRLGQVIVLIVVVFTLGCCLNAAIAVLVTSMMRVRTKAYEIGLLKAHGVSGGEILKMFCFQGLLIGGAGFLAACAVVVVLEPFIRRGLATVFGMSLDVVIEGAIHGAGAWWLFGLTLLVAMGFSLAGIILPALSAYRLSPVEALHQRDSS
jgi:hypothetical protein